MASSVLPLLLSSFPLLLSASFALILSFLLADPFKWGPIATVDFQPKIISLPPLPPTTKFTDPSNRLTEAKLIFRNQMFGPESIAFDGQGRGPYASISDGRVVRWNLDPSLPLDELLQEAEKAKMEEFATTSPSRNASLCSYSSPPLPNLPLEPLCGRPLGIRFQRVKKASGGGEEGGRNVALKNEEGQDGEAVEGEQQQQLLVADAYHGLHSVSAKNGGQAKLLTAEAEGQPFKFCNDGELNEEEGAIYFTDTSTKFQRRQFLVAILEGDNSGRLLRHDLRTGVTTELVRGLSFPNGLALSACRSFLVFCETTLLRCHRYWLKGPKSGTSEVFIDLPGFPDNVRLNPRGRFWIAIHSRRNFAFDWLSMRPWARSLLLRLLPNIKLVYVLLLQKPHGMILEVDADGQVTNVLEDAHGQVVRAVSEVEERGGKLWMGSVLMPHIAVMDFEGQ